MGWFNQVQALRLRVGWSQRDLAARARTSQQQVQRIESGLQAPRIGLALRIAQALGHPLEQVFPLPAPAAPPAAPVICADAAGLSWTLCIRLGGGAAAALPVAADELAELRRAIGEAAPAGRFLLFRSRHHEVALRLDRLSYARLQPGLVAEADAGHAFPPDHAVLFLAGDPAPLVFRPEPDDAAIEATAAEEGFGACRNQGLLAALDLGAFDGRDRFTLLDARDGEAVHLLAGELALLALPFDALSPGLPPSHAFDPPSFRLAHNDA